MAHSENGNSTADPLPENLAERFQRWIFSFLSFVCTIWGALSIAGNIFIFLLTWLRPDIATAISGKLAGPNFDKFVNLMDIHLGVVLAFVGTGSMLFLSTRSIRTLPKLADDIRESAIKLHDDRESNANTALQLATQLAGVKLSDVRKKHCESSMESLSAVAGNLDNWESHISAGAAAEKPQLVEVWLRSMRAYFLEEGYDIGKKELATNGKNFCFILLAALDAFIASAGDKKVVYTAVTPVSPVDWYNWPHGQPKRHFEETCISDYYRLLREVVRKYKSNSLQHSRYVLCAQNRDDSTLEKFKWAITRTTTLKDHLCGWMVPLSIPFNAIASTGNNSYSLALRRYFEAQWGLPSSTDMDPQNRSFVPLHCESWAANKNNAHPSHCLKTAPDIECITELIAIALKHHFDELTNAVIKTKPIRFPDDIENKLFHTLLDSAGECAKKEATPESVLAWMHDSHAAEARLTRCGDAAEVALLLQKVRSSILKCRDLVYVDTSRAQLVHEIFSHQLQTCGDDTYVSEMDVATVQEYSVEPEFHLFGYDKPGYGVDWQLAITSSLDYPFDVTRITLRDDQDSVKRYKDALALIDAKRKKMAAFVSSTK